ncbi:hypothetical protein RvY_09503 [Ramazzottius varieornatus]|uniref:MOB kinase activator-like 2 n=1 Tax=Ramazzottius varieornatus TaxID=947166 RepID=A0A1D1VC06_RAMVA|nr:hypothetical protein RvY_09503 [Ramazzottius varieornatus]
MTSGGEERLLNDRGHEKNPSSTSGRPFGERFGFGYFKDTFDWFTGKGKKKDRSDGSGDGLPSEDSSSKLYLNHMYLHRLLKNNHLRQIIPLPSQVDLNEWLATHIIPFFNHVNLLYGAISGYCTASTCPHMSAPNGMIYMWSDDKGRKLKSSAPQYIDFATTSVERMLKDETVFPSKHGLPFPQNFDVITRKIQRQLFFILAHLYHAHFDLYVQLGIFHHLNGLFAHFVLFSQHFNLIEPREMDVLRDLIDKLLADNDVIKEGEVQKSSGAVAVREEGTESPSMDKTVGEDGKDKVVEQSKAACDINPVDTTVARATSPLKLAENVAPINVKDLLAGNLVESSVI